MSYLVAWAQPDEFGFIPNNASGTFYGWQPSMALLPAVMTGWQHLTRLEFVLVLLIKQRIAYANLVIYGDDGTSTTSMRASRRAFS